MSIRLKCNCGRMIFAEENQRGQQLQCPHCQGVVIVPAGVAATQNTPASNPGVFLLIVSVPIAIGAFYFQHSLGKGTALILLGAAWCFVEGLRQIENKR